MIELRDYQEQISAEASLILSGIGCCYLSMECRTGKTITALITAHKYGAKSVLFITKKKAMASIKKDYDALRNATIDYAMDIVNHESAHKMQGEYDLVIIDEAHALGAYPAPSKKAQRIKRLCKGLPVIFMTGTPSPESYSQLFHQFWVCDYSPWKEYRNFHAWAKKYVGVRDVYINGNWRKDYSCAYVDLILRDINALMFSYTQEEAGFKTEIEENVLTVPMSMQTNRLLKEIYKNKVAYVRDDIVIEADTPAKLLTKMHQLLSGTVISSDNTHLILDKSKALFAKDYFKGKKIAIFYAYQTEADLLHEIFPNWTENPEEFQASTDKTFICQVRRAREGVRLDSADALVFYNLEYSYLSYEQGRNRIASMERETPCEVYFLCSDCGIESDILKAVHGKSDFTLSWYKKHGKH